VIDLAIENPISDGDLGKGEPYVLRLYVAGVTPRSVHAIENVNRICKEHLQGRWQLEVIDIYQQPALAKADQIIAAPTLVRKSPLPLRKLIGDMSDERRVLVGLGLHAHLQKIDGR
jgi:circadian clock protein KaiB